MVLPQQDRGSSLQSQFRALVALIPAVKHGKTERLWQVECALARGRHAKDENCTYCVGWGLWAPGFQGVFKPRSCSKVAE